jgi:hypothetical protein
MQHLEGSGTPVLYIGRTVLKGYITFALKLTLKSSYMFRCEKHHHQGVHYLRISKVTVLKMS